MNPNAKNLKEFKELIERYETITLEEIQYGFEIYKLGNLVGAKLTGYGTLITCTLCQALKEYNDKYVGPSSVCKYCVYGPEKFNCLNRDPTSYYDIYYAKTPEQFLEACRNRASFMRTLL